MTCVEDEGRLLPIRACMTNFLGRVPAMRPWENSSVASDAVAYTCGAIRRRGSAIGHDHDHDPDEWRLCRDLSDSAFALMDGVELPNGTEISPFFLVADRGTVVPTALDEAAVRAAFGGTLFPGLRVDVEPLEERGRWWSEVREYLVDNDDAEEDDEVMADGLEELEKWRALIRWFRGEADIRTASVVGMKSPRRPGPEWTCCNFPLLVLGKTRSGSLVGIWGTVVDKG